MASWPTLPDASTTRCTSAASPANVGSASTSRNDPDVSSSTFDRAALARSSDFGVKTTSGLRTSRCIWRRRRWKYWAAVVALATWMLSSAHSRQEPLDAGRAVLGPLALVAVREQQHEPDVWPHLSSAATRYWSMMIWAPLTKSPNCASQITSASLVGDGVAVLEAERGVLREQRVVDAELGLVGVEVGERRPVGLGLVVDEHRVALAERAPPAVLARRPGCRCPRAAACRRRRPRRGPSRPRPPRGTSSCGSRTAWPASGGR